MAESLMSLVPGSPPTSFAPVSVPDFVDPPVQCACAKCRKTLRPPVKQTICGHRLCAMCAHDLFQKDEHVMCPGKEEDCLELTPAQVMPDRATTRELLRKKVYCPNRQNGCLQTMKWTELTSHEVTCEWRKTPCTNKGCNKTVFASELQAHTRDGCEYRTELCVNCDKYVLKKELQHGHAVECAQIPRKCHFKGLGCTFEGNSEQMHAHLNTELLTHTKGTIHAIENLKLNHNTFQHKLEDMQGIITDVRNTVDSLTAEASHKTQIHALQRSVAKLSDNFNSLQTIVDQGASSVAVKNSHEDLQRIKEVSTMLESRIAHLENGSSSNQGSSDVVEKCARIERTVGMHDVRIAESDLRFRLLETASFDGRLIWRIPFYSRRKQDAVEGRTLSLYSQPFYSSYYGYKMCARVYPNGDGLGKGSHLSMFFVIMKGEYDPLLVWPFRQKVSISVLDQSGNRKHITDTFRPDPTSTSFRKPVGEMNIASGCPMFAAQSTVESEPYMKDDTLFISVTIDKSDLPQP